MDFKENMTELTEPTPTKTLDQHAADLDAWLKARGLVPVVVMQGIDTGHISPIADYVRQYPGHRPTFILQPRRDWSA